MREVIRAVIHQWFTEMGDDECGHYAGGFWDCDQLAERIMRDVDFSDVDR